MRFCFALLFASACVFSGLFPAPTFSQETCSPIALQTLRGVTVVEGAAGNENIVCLSLDTPLGSVVQLKVEGKNGMAFNIDDIVENQDQASYLSTGVPRNIYIYQTFRNVVDLPFTLTVRVAAPVAATTESPGPRSEKVPGASPGSASSAPGDAGQEPTSSHKDAAFPLPALPEAPDGVEIQDREELFRTLLSQHFVDESRKARERGEKGLALMRALQALPSEPEEKDFDRFPEAAKALYLAVADRSLVLPENGQAVVANLSPTGRVMSVGWAGFYQVEDGEGLPFGLYRTVDSSLVTQFRPISETHGWGFAYEKGPLFTSDGKIVALASALDGRVSLYDGETGTWLRDLREIEMEPGSKVGGTLNVIGFSPDDRFYAMSMDNTLAIWEVATGRLVEHDKLEGVTPHVFCYSWTYDGALLCELKDLTGLFDTRSGGPRSQKLVRKIPGGQYQDLLDLNPIVDPIKNYFTGLGAVSVYGPQYMLRFSDKVVVYDFSGQRLGDIPISQASVPSFAPDGQTVELASYDANELDVKVFRFDGTRVEPSRAAQTAFIHRVIGKEGKRSGFPNIQRANISYRGEDLPQGLDLYDQVWARLTAEEQERINANRVPATGAD